ncbi:DUF4926 domain-containing protein [Clostridium intestinale]|uniref:DUF4926 domain-containing protein n=1 Tax=Clostridium intestinale DSM 6191 TaxID=1121320 RepID=A0A1M5WDN7_9CLOT|nr:DUF4926 domain-containing protein [Clostridium intestinale]SHH85570.1 protein of unknown function [Clostridium intestinale DSM 6191]
MKFDLNDTVMVLKNYLNEGILKGELGAIVEVYTKPHEAYEVEFVDEDGKVKAILVLGKDDMCKYAE